MLDFVAVDCDSDRFAGHGGTARSCYVRDLDPILNVDSGLKSYRQHTQVMFRLGRHSSNASRK